MLFQTLKVYMLLLLFFVDLTNGWQYVLDRLEDVDTNILRPQTCDYLPTEEGVCGGQPVIPENEFRGTEGFWTRCSGGECSFTFYRIPNSLVPVRITIEAYHHGASLVIVAPDDYLGVPLQGTNSWMTHILDNTTSFPNLPNYNASSLFTKC